MQASKKFAHFVKQTVTALVCPSNANDDDSSNFKYENVFLTLERLVIRRETIHFSGEVGMRVWTPGKKLVEACRAYQHTTVRWIFEIKLLKILSFFAKILYFKL